MGSLDHRNILLNAIDFSLWKEWDERHAIIMKPWQKQNVSVKKSQQILSLSCTTQQSMKRTIFITFEGSVCNAQ